LVSYEWEDPDAALFFCSASRAGAWRASAAARFPF
jgi:hypothetical protein